jgi:G3E family GTPase
VCCQLSDALVETLVRLHEQVKPDRIIIETSGVALPFETQLHLYRPAVRSWLGEDACIVVVDATGSAFEAFEDPAGDAVANDTFIQQVQSADLVILSKVDLADPGPMRARLGGLAPDVPIIPAVNGDLPEGLFFPRGPRAGREPAPRAHHHENFESEELVISGGRSVAEVELQLGGLRALRVKGFVETTEGVRVVQGVGRRIELTPPGSLKVDPRLIGRVVVIRRASGHHSHEDHERLG